MPSRPRPKSMTVVGTVGAYRGVVALDVNVGLDSAIRPFLQPYMGKRVEVTISIKEAELIPSKKERG